MKQWTVILAIFTLFFSATLGQAASQDAVTLMPCSQIEMKSYIGNHSNGTFNVIIKTTDGRYFQKNFHSPGGLEQASRFVNDLNNCTEVLFHYQPVPSPAAFAVTTFQVFF